jgi:hypothetical protein
MSRKPNQIDREKGEMTLFSPTYGKFTAYFDPEDYEFVIQYTWGVREKAGLYYVHTSLCMDMKWRNFRFHRLLMNPPHNVAIDHRDGNGLNNRRKNLRACSSAQNAANQSISRANTSGFKGVVWDNRCHSWSVRIKKNGKRIYGGHFPNVVDAAAKYNELAIIYFGEFARLNIIK